MTGVQTCALPISAFHPPDYNVVDGIRGLQYQEHNIDRKDQMLRNNVVLAGEDAVATDAVVAHLMGFNPWDMEFLHMAAQRGLGTMDWEKIDPVGDDPDRARRRWGKPKGWFGRCNREWLVTSDSPHAEVLHVRCTAPTDTLHFTECLKAPAAPQTSYTATTRVFAASHGKAFLWAGVHGHLTVWLNGERVMEEENLTRYRIGQFQKPVELRPAENILVFRVKAASGEPRLSALLVGPRNDGDTVDGIRWSALT